MSCSAQMNNLHSANNDVMRRSQTNERVIGQPFYFRFRV